MPRHDKAIPYESHALASGKSHPPSPTLERLQKRTSLVLERTPGVPLRSVETVYSLGFCGGLEFGMAIEFPMSVPTDLMERHLSNKGGIFSMLETIIVILLVLWLVGLVAGQTFGGILHVLLLVAVVVFVIRLLTGRAAV